MRRTMHDGRGDGGRKGKHTGAHKLTRERALCAVSEPEASPYCVSPRVAFVSALVAPIVFCPHTRPFCFAASSLSRISLEPRPRKREASLSTDKGNPGVYPRLVPPLSFRFPLRCATRNFHEISAISFPYIYIYNFLKIVKYISLFVVIFFPFHFFFFFHIRRLIVAE